MAIHEMSDEDRAELFLVLGNVREEIHSLRSASSNLRQVIVPRKEHRLRRRLGLLVCAVSIFAAMNFNFAHTQYCVPPNAFPRSGSARTVTCDAVYPAFSHALLAHSPDAATAGWPSVGNVLGLVLYLVLLTATLYTFMQTRKLGRNADEVDDADKVNEQ